LSKFKGDRGSIDVKRDISGNDLKLLTSCPGSAVAPYTKFFYQKKAVRIIPHK